MRRHRPAVALLDVRMPVLDGLQAARKVLAQSPQTRVLILTTYDADEYVYEFTGGRRIVFARLADGGGRR